MYYDSNLYSFNWRICIYMCMREIECMCLCMRETNILKRECSCKFSCYMRDATTNILSHKFEFITSTFSFVIIDVTSIKLFYRMYIMTDIYSLCIGVCVCACVCKKGWKRERNKERNRERDRDRDREKETERERERGRKRERERGKLRVKKKERESDRTRETDWQTERVWIIFCLWCLFTSSLSFVSC